MKTTKKILSIVLAVMLLVGTVVVGVSADTTMVFEKTGSKLVYTATADKTEKDDEGYILVQPGDKITVSVYMQANYYLGTVGSEIFAWTTGFFNSVTLNSDITRHNFINNYTPVNNRLITAKNPRQLGTGYDNGKYEGYLYGRGYMAESGGPFDASTATLAYQFTFTVASTTADGATAEFVMPEPCSATAATDDRYIQIYAAVNNSETNYGSTSTASQYPETIDLTGTLLKFKVGTANEPCDYTDLDNAIAQYEKDLTDKDLYTADSWADYENAYKAAKDIEKNLVDDGTGANQAKIDAAEKALEDTKAALDLVEYCDYTSLQQAVNNCSELDSAEEYYDPTDLATWKAALKAAQDLLAADKLVKTDENQATINNAAQALTDAYDELYEIYVDTAPLSQAIAAYKTPEKAPEFYDETKYAAWQAALAAAQDGVIDYDGAADTAANRAAVAGLAADLKAAFEGLEANYVDTTALAQAVAAYGKTDYTAEYYDATEYATYTDALATANTALNSLAQAADTAENRAAVAEFAADLKTAYEELDARFVDIAALEKAVADYGTTEYGEELYDATEYAAWQNALAAAKAGVTSYADKADTAANQAAVAALAADLKAAHEALDARFVNVSDLEKAITESVPAYGSEYYDAAAYTAFQNAVSAGNALVKEYKGIAADTALNRQAVADAVNAIDNAFAKLDPEFIDYSALEEAVKNYGTTPEAADAYTTETYGPYAAALERAQYMLDNKNENAPASDTVLAAQISAAAKELESTFKALELVPEDTIITAVKCLQEHYKVGDTVKFTYLCSVTGVAKIQLIAENGSTLTYHRTHSAVNVKDNGDGTETWTIAIKIYFDKANMVAKAKLGKVWEANGFKYQTATSTGEDISIKSAEVLLDGATVTEFSTNDTVVIKIVAGPNTLRMRLVDKANGCTSTYSRSKATQDENGNWVWNITRKSAAGEYAYDIHTTGSSNRLSDEGTDLSYTVKAPVVVNGPSTGNDKDIVVSATSKVRIIRDKNNTVTVVTDKNAKGVRVVDQNGVVQGYNKDIASATDNGNGTLTWTITYKCTLAGSYTCNVDALYGNQWMNNDTTVTYTVKY